MMPETQLPQVPTQEPPVVAEETLASALVGPGVATPGVATPGVATPGVATPGVATPGPKGLPAPSLYVRAQAAQGKPKAAAEAEWNTFWQKATPEEKAFVTDKLASMADRITPPRQASARLLVAGGRKPTPIETVTHTNWSDFSDSFNNAISLTKKNFADLGDVVYDKVFGDGGEELAKTLESNQQLYEMRQLSLSPGAREDWTSNPAAFLAAFGGGLGSMMTTVGTSLLGLVPTPLSPLLVGGGIASAYAQGFGQVFDEMRQAGVPTDQAANWALAAGVPLAAAEYLLPMKGIARAIERPIVRGALNQAFGQIGRQGADVLATEAGRDLFRGTMRTSFAGMRQEMAARLAAVPRAALASGLSEGVEEGVQNGLTQLTGKAYDYFNETGRFPAGFDGKGILMDAAMGGLLGSLFGVGAMKNVPQNRTLAGELDAALESNPFSRLFDNAAFHYLDRSAPMPNRLTAKVQALKGAYENHLDEDEPGLDEATRQERLSQFGTRIEDMAATMLRARQHGIEDPDSRWGLYRLYGLRRDLQSQLAPLQERLSVLSPQSTTTVTPSPLAPSDTSMAPGAATQPAGTVELGGGPGLQPTQTIQFPDDPFLRTVQRTERAGIQRQSDYLTQALGLVDGGLESVADAKLFNRDAFNDQWRDLRVKFYPHEFALPDFAPAAERQRTGPDGHPVRFGQDEGGTLAVVAPDGAWRVPTSAQKALWERTQADLAALPSVAERVLSGSSLSPEQQALASDPDLQPDFEAVIRRGQDLVETYTDLHARGEDPEDVMDESDLEALTPFRPVLNRRLEEVQQQMDAEAKRASEQKRADDNAARQAQREADAAKREAERQQKEEERRAQNAEDAALREAERQQKEEERRAGKQEADLRRQAQQEQKAAGAEQKKAENQRRQAEAAEVKRWQAAAKTWAEAQLSPLVPLSEDAIAMQSDPAGAEQLQDALAALLRARLQPLGRKLMALVSALPGALRYPTVGELSTLPAEDLLALWKMASPDPSPIKLSKEEKAADLAGRALQVEAILAARNLSLTDVQLSQRGLRLEREQTERLDAQQAFAQSGLDVLGSALQLARLESRYPGGHARQLGGMARPLGQAGRRLDEAINRIGEETAGWDEFEVIDSALDGEAQPQPGGPALLPGSRVFPALAESATDGPAAETTPDNGPVGEPPLPPLEELLVPPPAGGAGLDIAPAEAVPSGEPLLEEANGEQPDTGAGGLDAPADRGPRAAGDEPPAEQAGPLLEGTRTLQVGPGSDSPPTGERGDGPRRTTRGNGKRNKKDAPGPADPALVETSQETLPTGVEQAVTSTPVQAKEKRLGKIALRDLGGPSNSVSVVVIQATPKEAPTPPPRARARKAAADAVAASRPEPQADTPAAPAQQTAPGNSIGDQRASLTEDAEGFTMTLHRPLAVFIGTRKIGSVPPPGSKDLICWLPAGVYRFDKKTGDWENLTARDEEFTGQRVPGMARRRFLETDFGWDFGDLDTLADEISQGLAPEYFAFGRNTLQSDRGVAGRLAEGLAFTQALAGGQVSLPPVETSHPTTADKVAALGLDRQMRQARAALRGAPLRGDSLRTGQVGDVLDEEGNVLHTGHVVWSDGQRVALMPNLGTDKDGQAVRVEFSNPAWNAVEVFSAERVTGGEGFPIIPIEWAWREEGRLAAEASAPGVRDQPTGAVPQVGDTVYFWDSSEGKPVEGEVLAVSVPSGGKAPLIKISYKPQAERSRSQDPEVLRQLAREQRGSVQYETVLRPLSGVFASPEETRRARQQTGETRRKAAPGVTEKDLATYENNQDVTPGTEVWVAQRDGGVKRGVMVESLLAPTRKYRVEYEDGSKGLVSPRMAFLTQRLAERYQTVKDSVGALEKLESTAAVAEEMAQDEARESQPAPGATPSMQQAGGGRTLARAEAEALAARLRRAFPRIRVLVPLDEDAYVEQFRIAVAPGLPPSERLRVPVGFVDNQTGILYLSPTRATLQTPLHEFGHVWNSWAKQNARERYEYGRMLVRQNLALMAQVKGEYPWLSGEALEDEAMARLIGQQAQELPGDKTFLERAAKWLRGLWQAIGQALGIGQTQGWERLADMTLSEFAGQVAEDLQSGEAISETFSSADLMAMRTVMGPMSAFFVGTRGIDRLASINPKAQRIKEDFRKARAFHNRMLHNKESITPEEIFLQTGWLKGPDGKWRYAFDKALGVFNEKVNARINELLRDVEENFGAGETIARLSLKELIGDDALLLRVYPELGKASIALIADIKSGGEYFDSGGADEITINIDRGETTERQRRFFKDTLVHEIQHAIQSREGFDPGEHYYGYQPEAEVNLYEASEDFAQKADLYEAIAAVNETYGGGAETRKALMYKAKLARKFAADLAASKKRLASGVETTYDIYKRNIGETEARDVARRSALYQENGNKWEDDPLVPGNKITPIPSLLTHEGLLPSLSAFNALNPRKNKKLYVPHGGKPDRGQALDLSEYLDKTTDDWRALAAWAVGTRAASPEAKRAARRLTRTLHARLRPFLAHLPAGQQGGQSVGIAPGAHDVLSDPARLEAVAAALLAGREPKGQAEQSAYRLLTGSGADSLVGAYLKWYNLNHRTDPDTGQDVELDKAEIAAGLNAAARVATGQKAPAALRPLVTAITKFASRLWNNDTAALALGGEGSSIHDILSGLVRRGDYLAAPLVRQGEEHRRKLRQAWAALSAGRGLSSFGAARKLDVRANRYNTTGASQMGEELGATVSLTVGEAAALYATHKTQMASFGKSTVQHRPGIAQNQNAGSHFFGARFEREGEDAFRLTLTDDQLSELAAHFEPGGEFAEPFRLLAETFASDVRKNAVGEMMRRVLGRGFDPVAWYFPTRAYAADTQSVGASLRGVSKLMDEISYLQARRAPAEEVRIADAIDTAENFLRQSEAFVARQETITSLGAWLQAARATRAADLQVLKPAIEYAERYLEWLARTSSPGPDDPASRLIGQLSANVTRSLFAFKVGTPLKQASGYTVAFGQGLIYDEHLKAALPTLAALTARSYEGWARGRSLSGKTSDPETPWLQKIQANRFAHDSPLWVRILGRDDSVTPGVNLADFRTAGKRAGVAGQAWQWLTNEIDEYALGALHRADRAVMIAFYDAAERQVRAERGETSSDQAQKRIADLATAATYATNQMYNPATGSELQRDPGVFARIFSLFAGQPIRVTNLFFQAFLRWAHSGYTDQAARKQMVSALSWGIAASTLWSAIVTVGIAAVKGAGGDEEDDKDLASKVAWEWSRQLLGAVPGMPSAALSSLTTYLDGEAWSDPVGGQIAMEAIEKIFKGVGNLSKSLDEDLSERAQHRAWLAGSYNLLDGSLRMAGLPSELVTTLLRLRQ